MGDTSYDDIYRLLLQQLQDGIILTDPTGNVIFVNSAAESIRNIHKNDIMGNNVLDCHMPTSKGKVQRSMDFLRANPDKTYHRMVNDERNHKVYENTYTAIYDEANEIRGLAVITKDMTKARQEEEQNAAALRTQNIFMSQLQNQYQDLIMHSMEMLTNLLDARDKYTNGHSKRVAALSSKLYEYRYGINETYLDVLWAAKLHDIGKICIPDHIIQKDGSLTLEEYSIIKNHSSIASDIVKSLDPDNRITPAIRHHHERYDGRGYPDGLARDEIPLGARIITIADSFDAMSSNRPYRQALPYEQCLDEIIKNSGTQFDPEWVEIFADLANTGSIL